MGVAIMKYLEPVVDDAMREYGVLKAAAPAKKASIVMVCAAAWGAE